MSNLWRAASFAAYVSGMGLCMVSSAQASGGGQGHFENGGDHGHQGVGHIDHGNGLGLGHERKHGVPEVGAHGAPAALALALGGVAVMVGKRKRRP